MHLVCSHLLTLTAGNWIAVAAIVTPIVVGVFVGIGRMLYKQGEMDTVIEGLIKTVDTLDEKFDKYVMQPLARGSSPLNLTKEGKELFDDPMVQQFIKAELDKIIDQVKATRAESAYQAQEVLFKVVEQYKDHPGYRVDLENVAFNTGHHIDILMKVIAIGIREDVFNHLTVDIADIDNSDPSLKK